MRGLIALLLIAAIIGIAAFLADYPGRVEIVWRGWQLDTSVGVLAAALAVAALLLWAALALLTGLARLPRRWRRRRRERRRRLGDASLTRGLVALAGGDAAAARREAERAGTLLERAPLPLLLAAEAAQQQGDGLAARRYFVELLERPDSEFLGLRGLLGQALRGGDDGAARSLAERGRRMQPAADWLIDILLALQARTGGWRAARDTLADAAVRKALPAGRVRHHLGVVLDELSRDSERHGDLRGAAALAAKAQAAAPDLAAPAAQHARMLLALGRTRAARKAIERAWRTAPHPDLARVYLEIDSEGSSLARAASLQRLAAQNPDAAESHLAIAEAALAAQLPGEARRHLGIAVAAAPPPGPSRRLCLLMARLEQGEPGGAEAARRWLDRAAGAPPDPCYVCGRCRAESGEWHSVCPQCGGFDTLAWGVPVRGAAASGAAADDDTSAPLMVPAPRPAGAAAAPSALAAPRQYDK